MHFLCFDLEVHVQYTKHCHAYYLSVPLQFKSHSCDHLSTILSYISFIFFVFFPFIFCASFKKNNFSPDKVLETPSLRLNGTYYITKQILPALDRVFTLMGVDVFCWYVMQWCMLHVGKL